MTTRLVLTALDPTPDEARTWLRRELLRPEYQERDLVGRLVRWGERQFYRLLDAAGEVPPLSALAAMVVGLLLLVAAGWGLSRLRGSGRARAGAGPVLQAEELTGDQLRERALAALADDEPSEALVDAFRALVVHQVERGQVDDAAGATAHELATALEQVHPQRRDDLEQAAGLFDLVRYGDRSATRAQATTVLALDEELAGVRANGPGGAR